MAALFVLAVAGCFTGPINHAPQVSIMSLGPVLRGQPASYHAAVTDADNDWDLKSPQALTWAVVMGDCTTDTGPASWPPASMRSVSSPDAQELVVDASETLSQFCVWAFATDAHNAAASDHLLGDPQNGVPTAQINVVAPDPATTSPTITYPLYSTFQLSGAASSDPEGDTLTDDWTFDHVPGGSTSVLASCANAPLDECFSADKPGEYDVSLAVADPLQAQGTTTVQIVVNPDQPPCIEVSDPDFKTPMLVLDPTVANPFVIRQVADDGAPTPPTPTSRNATQFKWYLARNDEPLVFSDNDFPSMTLVANTYAIGDTVRVRVEVLDGTQNTNNILAGCGDQDLCQAVPGCFQRVTWSIDFR